MAARQWTQAQRERQAKLIHRWKPWEKSTGPRTLEGKRISSRNADRYALREIMRENARATRELINYLTGKGELPNWSRTAIDFYFEMLRKSIDRQC